MPTTQTARPIRRRPNRKNDYPDWPGERSGRMIRIEELEGKRSCGCFRASFNKKPDASSVRSQDQAYSRWIRDIRTTDVAREADDDRSAGGKDTRPRDGFNAILDLIENHGTDIVWFLTSSRQTRGDFDIRELCEFSAAHGAVWCFNGEIYNPRNKRDVAELVRLAQDDERDNDQKAIYVTEARERDIMDGKPYVTPRYGHVRTYAHDEDGNRVFRRDVADLDPPDGHGPEDAPAKIVLEILTRAAAGQTYGEIRRDLERRRIPRPRPRKDGATGEFAWTLYNVRSIATNEFYAGRPKLRGKLADLPPGIEVKWDILVPPDLFDRAQKALAHPDAPRNKHAEPVTRPGAADGNDWDYHLLTGTNSAARCDVCGSPLATIWHRGARWYRCREKGCTRIKQDQLDAHVEDLLVTWGLRDDVQADLKARRADDSQASADADREIAHYEVKRDEARDKAKDEDEDEVYWSRRAKMWADKLKTALKAQPTGVPPHVAEFVGPYAAEFWDESPTSVRRKIARDALSIRIMRGHVGGYVNGERGAFDENRVSKRWLLGPDAQPDAPSEPSGQPPRPTPREEAASWLQEYLGSHGNRALSPDVRAAALAAGHTRVTLRRAAKKIGVSFERTKTVRSTSVWVLPR
jgi:hypothetical protein